MGNRYRLVGLKNSELLAGLSELVQRSNAITAEAEGSPRTMYRMIVPEPFEVPPWRAERAKARIRSRSAQQAVDR
jgi:hypothetical protein